MTAREEISIDVSPEIGSVSAILDRPPVARAILALAHGAGAGMRHRFLEALAAALAERRVATLRYQFPYMEAGSRRPDRPETAHAAVRAAAAEARRRAPDLPLIAGGKSFGGRMTSQAQARTPLPGVRAIVFVGFPLHPAGKPGIERAAHLDGVAIPMLFLQGTRDELAEMTRMRGVAASLGDRATLQVIDGADHAFKVPRSTGRSDADVIAELASAIVRYGAPA
ncbi:MAG: alpha/beta family hydrolase [Acidobacteriota bacterium]